MQQKKIVKSFVGGHSVRVYEGSDFDPAIRKYRGGKLVLEVPPSGTVLSVRINQTDSDPLEIDGVQVRTKSDFSFVDVDPIPPADECDFCIVSAMYVAACKSLGLDTSRLLTIGGVVVDENDNVIGINWLNRN